MFTSCPASHSAEPYFVGRRGYANPFNCGPDASASFTNKNGSLTILAQTFIGSPSEAGAHITLKPGTKFVQLNWASQGDYNGNFEPRVRWNFEDGTSIIGNAFSTNIGPVRKDGFRIVSLYNNSYGSSALSKFNSVNCSSIDILYTNNTAAHNGYITGVLVNGLVAPGITPTLTCPQ
jgi:hypothetical protein